MPNQARFDAARENAFPYQYLPHMRLGRRADFIIGTLPSPYSASRVIASSNESLLSADLGAWALACWVAVSSSA